MHDFIALAKAGKNDWWRYLASAVLIIFMWMIVGSVPLMAVVFINGGMPFPWAGEAAVPGPLSAIDPFFTFYIPIAFSFVALAAAVLISIRFIHGRSPQSLITGAKRIDKGRIATGFGIFLAINVVANAATYALDPSSIVVSLDPGRLLLLAPVYLALTAVQTTGEELLFRGYLLQGIGNAVKRPLLAALLSSALFMIVHLGNPEVSSGLFLAAAYYFVVGFWLCLITLKDGTLELAIGAHAANNMFILLMNYETSALEIVPSVFKSVGVGEEDLVLSLGLFILLAGAAYFLLFNGNRKISRPV
jgi:membrane protease YdiL (CAAX protease family)